MKTKLIFFTVLFLLQFNAFSEQRQLQVTPKKTDLSRPKLTRF